MKKWKRKYSVTKVIQLRTHCQGKCTICHKKLDCFSEVISVDHILPLSKWGNSEITNLQITCMQCNAEKADNYEDDE